MDKDRTAAYQILKKIAEDRAYSNLAVNEYIRDHEVVSPAFIRELVYGVLRNEILLDHCIGNYVSAMSKTKLSDKIILRMGFYQLARMDSVKSYAAVNESVELAKRFAKGRDRFINAVLRNFERGGCALDADEPEIKYSCHPELYAKLREWYGNEKALAIIENSVKVPPLTTRENRNGTVSIQGKSSAKAVETLAPKPGEKLLDLCAAPGGKSIYAAELMENKGSITSCDLHPHRVELIEKEAVRTGESIITTMCLDATVFNKDFENSFDAVICDVPCTGLGTIAKKPEIKLRGLPDKKDLAELYRTQKAIFDNAAKYVKAGGRVLYSTCTLNPEENEKQLETFLVEHENFERMYSETILPKGEYDGFYIATVKRKQ